MDNSAADSGELQEELNTREKELAAANQKAEGLQSELDQLNADAENSGVTEEAMIAYNQLMKGIRYYQDENTTYAALSVKDYKAADFENKDAKALFKLISKELTQEDVSVIFETGRNKYNDGQYEEALLEFEVALTIDPLNQDVLYFMGRSYHQMDKPKLAKSNYGKVLSVDETTDRAAEAASQLRALGVSQERIDAYAEEDPEEEEEESPEPTESPDSFE
jgi:tetratricopeptide (TPR) repeat protein